MCAPNRQTTPPAFTPGVKYHLINNVSGVGHALEESS